MIADIPGLIEGAAEGAGLGHEFLAHVERCRLLVHLVEIDPAEGYPASNYEAVRSELGSYGAGLDRLPEIVALSKRDLVPEERVGELLPEWRGRAGEVLAISSATGEGLDDLVRAMFAQLPEGGQGGGADGGAGRGAATGGTPGLAAPAAHRVYRPGEEEGFDVVAEGDGRFRIEGRGIEMLVARHDLANEEALNYLESRLREIGVIAELQRAGFRPGDEVVVGEVEFELDPSS